MKLLRIIVLSATLLLTTAVSAGCNLPVDKALDKAHHSKYVADTAFATQMQTAVAWGNQGWNQKHVLQSQIIEESWQISLKKNADANGKISVDFILRQLEQKRKDEALLSQSQKSAEDLARVFAADIAAYMGSNREALKTEEDALEAKRSADVAAQAILQSAGSLAGGFFTGFMVH